MPRSRIPHPQRHIHQWIKRGTHDARRGRRTDIQAGAGSCQEGNAPDRGRADLDGDTREPGSAHRCFPDSLKSFPPDPGRILHEQCPHQPPPVLGAHRHPAGRDGDTSALDKLMEEIGEILDRPATDARLQLVDGKVTVLDSTDGSVVDREELRGRIKQRLFTLDVRDIEIPMMVTEPYLKAADTETAANQAEVRLSAPITVTSGEDEWTLTTQDIASYLDFTVKGTGADSRLVPVI